MIEPYEFIDKNGDGDKERLTGATVQLFNKLSADETNLFRDKINEIIAHVNGLNVLRSKHIATYDLESSPMSIDLTEGQVVYLVTINEIVHKSWTQSGASLEITDYPLTEGYTDKVTVYYEE